MTIMPLIKRRSLAAVPLFLFSFGVLAQPGIGSGGFDSALFKFKGFGNNPAIAMPYGWTSAGGGYLNTRFQSIEWQINSNSAKTLGAKWTFNTDGDVSATPTVEGTSLYVPDWSGAIYNIDTELGTAIWKVKLSDYTGNAASLSRNSPAISANSIVLGDQAAGTVLALDKKTGKLLWKTTVEPNVQAHITSSPIIYNNRIYVGVSSNDFANMEPNHKFTFRGSVVALDLATGNKLWQFYTVPEGYTGASVWGQMAIDPIQKRLFFGTGNNYDIPSSVGTCVSNVRSSLGDKVTVQDELNCMAPNNYVDTVGALDLDTGKLAWAQRMQGYDAWNLSCLLAPNDGLCPDSQAKNLKGPDYDFGGAGINLFITGHNGKIQALVGAGQKSGKYWAFDAFTGKVVWSTQVGPGGTTGGIEWGTAFDPYKSRIYVAINNNTNASYTLGPDNKVSHNGGSWAALDAATGKIVWQVKVPGVNPVKPNVPAGGQGPVSASPGVVYAGSMSGAMVALDADTGAALWSFDAGGSVASSPSIVNGVLYWGAGYSHFGFGTSVHKLYKFVPNANVKAGWH